VCACVYVCACVCMCMCMCVFAHALHVCRRLNLACVCWGMPRCVLICSSSEARFKQDALIPPLCEMRLIIFAVRTHLTDTNGAVNTKCVCSVCLHSDVMTTPHTDLSGERQIGDRLGAPWTGGPLDKRAPGQEAPGREGPRQQVRGQEASGQEAP